MRKGERHTNPFNQRGITASNYLTELDVTIPVTEDGKVGWRTILSKRNGFLHKRGEIPPDPEYTVVQFGRKLHLRRN